MLRLEFASEEISWPDPCRREVVLTDPFGHPVAFAWRDADQHWVSVPGRARFRFRPGHNVVTVHLEDLGVSTGVFDAYLGVALPLALQVVFGRQTVHASAVLVPQCGVVAACGDSRAGKTTVAYGLSRHGYRLWADDVVAIHASASEVASIRLPFEINLRPPAARFFAHSSSVGLPEPTGVPPEWAEERLGAVLVLERSARRRRGDGRHRIEPLPPRQALLALLRHSFVFRPQSPLEKRRMVEDYLEVVAGVPVLRVRVVPGFDRLPDLLHEIEQCLELLPTRNRS